VLRRKKAEPKTPHLFSLDQDIVALPQEEKWGLKYVIHTLSGPVWALDFSDLSLARFCLKTLPEMIDLKLIPGYYKLFHG
jgi:hypothetical protein